MAGRDDTERSTADLDEETLARFEAAHPKGLTSHDILDVLGGTRYRISEATLRKWVQLGLLPRSVRVGTKGKHKGSLGMYPVAVIRQILRIKQMMAGNFTIDEIQREFLFARSDIEETERVLSRVIKGLELAVAERARGPVNKALVRDVAEARSLSSALIDKLGHIEDELTMQARLKRVAV